MPRIDDRALRLAIRRGKTVLARPNLSALESADMRLHIQMAERLLQLDYPPANAPRLRGSSQVYVCPKCHEIPVVQNGKYSCLCEEV